ncbi:OmpW/AlkL family protein, partial [Caldimonas tepidiphila]|uniref:OmpW/AlkL family protein n=1 Tax=Caldimonas tepidiphila TaxID=2315841 RepID=UPI0013005787
QPACPQSRRLAIRQRYLTYFFSPNLAAELILTYPQKHTLKAGTATLGTLKHLPPTLSLQYHLSGFGNLKPYVGAGVNFTRFSDVKVNHPTAGALDVERNSVGLSVQAGLDFALDKNWSLNVDVKKVRIETDVKVKSSGQTLGTFTVDPVLVGVGVGYRF